MTDTFERLGTKVVEHAPESEKDSAIREMLLRHAMSRRKWNHLWFVDYADESTKYFLESTVLVDPPPAVLERLSGSGAAVFGVSQARRKDHGITDTSGKHGYVVHARITRWLDPETAEVEYGDYRDSEAAGGGEGVVRRIDGEWVLQPGWIWCS